MDTQGLGHLAGIAAIAALALGAAAGCGLSPTQPSVTSECKEPDLTQSCSPDDDPVDTALRLEAADQLRLAGVVVPWTPVHG